MLLLVACVENTLQKSGPPAFDDGAAGHDTAVDTDTDTDTTPVDTADSADSGTGQVDDTDTAVLVDTGDDTTPVDTGEDTRPTTTGAIAVTGRCGASTWTGWSDTAAAAPELHVVGMYESDGGSPGPAYVTFTRAAESILVLTSYSPVDWQVDLVAGTDVTRIIVSNYDAPPSTVTFLSRTTAPVVNGGWVGACAYEIPDMDPTSGCETPDLQAILEAGTGLAMSSFQGCYSGGEFTVE
jgi:hypothetical protein